MENPSKSSLNWTILILLCLSVLSVWSIYKLAIAPIKPPQPPELPNNAINDLQAKGWRLSERIGARSNQKASTSAGVALLRSSNDVQGDSVEMLLVPVRMRGFSLLGTVDIRAYGTSEPQLSGKTLTIGGDQIELATDRSGRNYFSTCVTRNGVASNKALTLRDAIKTETISASRRIEILLGFKPPRDWTCLFVQLSSRASNNDMLEMWKSIRPFIGSAWGKQ